MYIQNVSYIITEDTLSNQLLLFTASMDAGLDGLIVSLDRTHGIKSINRISWTDATIKHRGGEIRSSSAGPKISVLYRV